MNSPMNDEAQEQNPAWNVFNGGRALNAIWSVPKEKITSTEKIVLLFLGSQMNFESKFAEWRFESYGTIAERTCLTKRTIINTVGTLIEKGYVVKMNRKVKGKVEGKKKNLSNFVRFTMKLFNEYEEYLRQKPSEIKTPDIPLVNNMHQGSEIDAPGVVKHLHPNSLNKNSLIEADILSAKNKNPAKVIQPSENDMKLAVRWLDDHLKDKFPRKYEHFYDVPELLADQFRKIRKRMKYSDEHMTQIVDCFIDDPFWSNVTQVPSGLLNKSKKNDCLNIEYLEQKILKPMSDEAKFQRDLDLVCGKDDEEAPRTSGITANKNLETDWGF